jgi:hypothetical protein
VIIHLLLQGRGKVLPRAWPDAPHRLSQRTKFARGLRRGAGLAEPWTDPMQRDDGTGAFRLFHPMDASAPVIGLGRVEPTQESYDAVMFFVCGCNILELHTLHMARYTPLCYAPRAGHHACARRAAHVVPDRSGTDSLRILIGAMGSARCFQGSCAQRIICTDATAIPPRKINFTNTCRSCILTLHDRAQAPATSNCTRRPWTSLLPAHLQPLFFRRGLSRAPSFKLRWCLTACHGSLRASGTSRASTFRPIPRACISGRLSIFRLARLQASGFPQVVQ